MAAENRTDFDQVVKKITQNYISDEVFVTKENRRLPGRSSIIILIKRLMFPGYFEEKNFEYMDAQYFAGNTLNSIRRELRQQVEIALLYTNESRSREQIAQEADETAQYFIGRLADIQNMLLKDVQAGFDGDPAAKSRQEIISSYPGVFAIFVYRMAHELYIRQVPFIPRIMSEYAHSRTGIDIGEYFFIDHGTGVVIGETTQIGDNVKLYQGVTLGALSTRKGQLLADVKRHPTIENHVTIYSGATILGGETVIGANSIIGGNTFITESVPAYTKVSLKAPEMVFQADPPKTGDQGGVWDWVI